MKTRRILIVALASFLLSTFAFAEVRSTPYQEMPDSKGERTRTAIYKGDRVPFVELPVVEIVETAETPSYLPAAVIKGEFTAVAELPVVDIIAANPGHTMLPLVKNNGQQVAAVYLPVVDIEAALPLDKLVSVKLINGEPMVTATLEAVEICDSRLPVTPQGEGIIAQWNPSSQSNPELLIGRSDENTFFLMSYQGTAIDQKGDEVLVYKLISQVKNSVLELIRNLGNL